MWHYKIIISLNDFPKNRPIKQKMKLVVVVVVVV